MKLFLKEFGIWMGGLLLLNLLLTIVLINYVPYGFFIIMQWLLPIIGVIIAITRLKKNHQQVSFGKSFGAGAIVAAGYMVLSMLVTAIMYPDYLSSSFGYLLQDELLKTLILITVVLYILLIAGTWYTLKKAGKPGYAFLIPIYNIIVMLEVAKKPLWWLFMLLIPLVNIVFAVMTINGVSKNFGKDEGFTVGLIFLSPIFWAILGYGDAEYIDGEVANKQLAKEDVIDDL